MTSINPSYSINQIQTSAFKTKDRNEVANEQVPSTQDIEKNGSLNGTEALATYNYNLINKHHSPKYIEGCAKVLNERDLNKDGETSVEEALQDDNFKITNPDLHERDKISLQKYAERDGNSNVTAEEYADWLNGPEHEKILDEFTLLRAEEIKKKQQN